jgi:hypothetical protein
MRRDAVQRHRAPAPRPDGRHVRPPGRPEDIAGILTAVADGHTGYELDHPEYPGATVGDITEIELEVFVR